MASPLLTDIGERGTNAASRTTLESLLARCNDIEATALVPRLEAARRALS